MIEYPSDKSLAPVVITITVTMQELGAILSALLMYYAKESTFCPDDAWSLVQRLTKTHGECVQHYAERVLFDRGFGGKAPN